MKSRLRTPAPVTRHGVTALCTSVLALTFIASVALGQPPWPDAKWVAVDDQKEPGDGYQLRIQEAAAASITVSFETHGYWSRTVDTEEQQFRQVQLPRAELHEREGYPELPVLTVNLVVPAGTTGVIPREDSIETVWTASEEILPSRGAIRNVDDTLKPYRTGPFYETGDVFPEQMIEVSPPYVFRNLRGVTVRISPFQFDRRGRLRVARRLSIRLNMNGGESWLLEAAEGGDRLPLNAEFVPIYRSTFQNFDEIPTLPEWLSTPAAPIAPLLIVAPHDWDDALIPLINWKRQKGISVYLESFSEPTPANIKQTIRDYFHQKGIGHVILVGDHDLICSHPGQTGHAIGNEADPVYGLIDGDHWPEVFISRLSAENTNELSDLIERCIRYEREPTQNVDWFSRGIWVASQSDNNCQWSCPLRQHLENHLGVTMQAVCSLTGSAHTDFRDAVNDGVSLVLYTGHGSRTEWLSIGFDKIR